ncbi:EB module [Ancylostoma duodenale]|uniref:EB module n=1 Tax=Ancylostoma duodenale TaxID=51022 RepID=A0A0C2DGB7_9BILA|nr:EB module [Ancylostoma duodenale]
MCACPPEKPILQGDACVAQQYRKIATPGESCDENTECTKESSCHGGQCRCQYGYIAVSGQCVALPMPTTPAMKNVVLARPLDSCDNGEQCEGGSSCDQDTGVCMCPPGYIVYGVQCQPPPQSTAMQPAATPIPQAAPTFAVSVNTEIELGERPVPVSYAKHKVETLSSERIVDQAEFTDSTAMPILPSPRTPSRQETQRPRIVGPPIRRPKPKSKGGSSTGTTTGSYKTSTGNGACPPGNEPTRDDDGRLILCNGLEPNCPPRSYCYITSGGFATEEYNCCKSW